MDTENIQKNESQRLSFIKYFHIQQCNLWPALVAQLDAPPTGDQEVAGSTPARSATFFHGRSAMKYFLRSFPSADSRRAVVSFW